MMSAKSIWTSENDEFLIDFVKDHEALFNVKSKDYKKGLFKQNLWNEIGTTIEKSASDCYKRWAYIRDYYIRSKGKSGTGSSGEAVKKRSQLLSFLDGIPSSNRNTFRNNVKDKLPRDESEIQIEATDLSTTTNEENKADNNEDVMNDNMGNKKKKFTYSEQRLQLNKNIAEQQVQLDETDHFFNSILKIVKKLPRHEQALLRIQISTLVGNAELRSISKETKPNCSYSTPSIPDIIPPTWNEKGHLS